MSDALQLALFEGDGIGPEIVAGTRRVIDEVAGAVGLTYECVTHPIGFSALEKYGTTFPEEALRLAQESDGVVLGPVSHLDYPSTQEGGFNPSGALRRELDLYANIRPARTYEGVQRLSQTPFDLVVVRENTEGFYADRTMHIGTGEVMPTPDLAMSFRKVTREGSLRIARQAFELAGQRGTGVTAVHKSNVLRVSDGLFLECVRQVAAEHPEIEYREELVDAMAALLIRAPEQFGVIVTTNMFGDILSDEATELSGSIGLAASLNVGEKHGMAQAQHGSAPSLAGQDKANPASLIGSVAMLFGWLGERRREPLLLRAGDAITDAITSLVAEPATRTGDLGGTMGTQEFSRAVAEVAAGALRG